MLIGGGMSVLTRDEGKVLALLERNGIFLTGAALVGTIAFRAYANLLGVSWPSEVGTQDIDIAVDDTILFRLILSMSHNRGENPLCQNQDQRM